MNTTPTPTPPENRIAGKRFYIAASYSDQASREALTMLIMMYGGAVVGHPISADYYVAVNYNKPKILGAEVLNIDTLKTHWVSDAINERALRESKFNPHNTDLDTELRKQAHASVHDKLDLIIKLLTTYNIPHQLPPPMTPKKTMQTEIIPEIIEEPIKAGCAPGNETIGYLAGEISRLRGALRTMSEAGDLLRERASFGAHASIEELSTWDAEVKSNKL